jgi:hypothetical protein
MSAALLFHLRKVPCALTHLGPPHLPPSQAQANPTSSHLPETWLLWAQLLQRRRGRVTRGTLTAQTGPEPPQGHRQRAEHVQCPVVLADMPTSSGA